MRHAVAVVVMWLFAGAGTSARAAEYSEEQTERCSSQIANLKTERSRADLAPAAKAEAVSRAEAALKTCFDIVAASPEPDYMKKARRKCPCKEGDLEWSDDESRACRVPITSFYRVMATHARVNPAVDQSLASDRNGYLAPIRTCLLRQRAAGEEKGMVDDLDRRAQQAVEAHKVDPCLMKRMGERMAGIYAVNGREAPKTFTAVEKSHWRDVVRVADECAENRVNNAELEARMANRDFVRKWLSYRICYVQQERKRTEGILKSERQSAKTGLGVINKRVAYRWQGEIVIDKKNEADARNELKRRKLTPSACDAREMPEFSTCIGDSRTEVSFSDDPETEYTEASTEISNLAQSCTPWPATQAADNRGGGAQE